MTKAVSCSFALEVACFKCKAEVNERLALEHKSLATESLPKPERATVGSFKRCRIGIPQATRSTLRNKARLNADGQGAKAQRGQSGAPKPGKNCLLQRCKRVW